MNKIGGGYDDEELQQNDRTVEGIYKVDESIYNQCEEGHKKGTTLVEARAKAIGKLLFADRDDN